MDRVIIYPGQVPLETDLLQTNKFAMVALSKLAAAVLGTATLANGFSVVPTGPASLSVNVNPGEIYSLQNIDGTAYSSIAADTTHSIVKQGISLDIKNLTCAAPGSVGQSINYLVQATYTDSDSGAIVLPYYNASNPAVAYSGPGGTGVAQNTLRQGIVTLQAKAGVAAATGSQVTPAPDAGFVGLYVVTVANGQTTINSGNISLFTGAPIISETLTQKISQTTGDSRYLQAGVATGRLINTIYYSVVAQTVTISIANPAVVTYASADKLPKENAPIVFSTSGALPTGVTAGTTLYVKNASGTTSQLSATPGGAAIVTTGSQSGTQSVANPPYLKATNNPAYVITEVWGGGGGSGGIGGSAYQAPGGGGAGGYARQKLLSANLLTSETVTIGAGGSAGTTTPTSGGTGGTSSFGTHSSATGGTGSQLIISGSGATGYGGPGGTGVTGDLNLAGNAGTGGSANINGINYCVGGTGGATTLGGVPSAPNNLPANGTSAANNSGSGASGPISNTSAQTGGVGGSGFVIVYEYA